MRDHVAKYFRQNPVCFFVISLFERQLGIGSTYNSHPVALASAYAALKVFFRDDVLGNVQRMEPVMKARSCLSVSLI
jgi:adenosylmethionine-8-amino-7-oxononanoate aminotransferase